MKVIICGGGIMGTSCALELARAGAEVTVLEKAVPGAEASSAAAGILGTEVEAQSEGPFVDLCRLSRALYSDWVKDLEKETSIELGFRERGVLEVCYNNDELDRLKALRGFQIEAGRSELKSAAELLQLEPGLSSKIAGGLFFPGDAQIVPRQLFRATHIAAQNYGVKFTTGAYVRRIVTEGSAPRVRGVELEDGQLLEADNVVVAAGSWTPLIDGLPLSKRSVIPARGQIISLRHHLRTLSRVVFAPDCYLIPRDDGQLLVGSTLEFVGYKKGVTAAALRDLLQAALRCIPALAEAEMDDSWSNFRPYTEDHMPLLGDGGVDGLALATGHYRNGILLTPITAKLIKQIVFKEPTSLPLAPFCPK